MTCDQLRLQPRGWSHNRSDRNIETVLLLTLVRTKTPHRDPQQHHDFKFIKSDRLNEAQSGSPTDIVKTAVRQTTLNILLRTRHKTLIAKR